jgi:hypothetical protein
MLRSRLAAGLIIPLTITACTAGGPRDTDTRAVTTAAPSSTVTQLPSVIPMAPTPVRTVKDDTCQTQNLRLSFGAFNGAGGTDYTVDYLTNVGTTTCTMIGYPGLAGLDANGNIVQHAAVRNADLPSEQGRSPIKVALAPGARAVFGVTNSDTTPNADCPAEFPIAQIQVYPPNQTTAIRMAPQGLPDAGICDLTVGFVQADS